MAPSEILSRLELKPIIGTSRSGGDVHGLATFEIGVRLERCIQEAVCLLGLDFDLSKAAAHSTLED